jgi:hypothetical protein
MKKSERQDKIKKKDEDKRDNRDERYLWEMREDIWNKW